MAHTHICWLLRWKQNGKPFWEGTERGTKQGTFAVGFFVFCESPGLTGISGPNSQQTLQPNEIVHLTRSPASPQAQVDVHTSRMFDSAKKDLASEKGQQRGVSLRQLGPQNEKKAAKKGVPSKKFEPQGIRRSCKVPLHLASSTPFSPAKRRHGWELRALGLPISLATRTMRLPTELVEQLAGLAFSSFAC